MPSENPDSGALFAAAQQHHKANRLSEAIALYRSALTFAPHSARGHYALANALASQGELEGAAASFARAIVIEPGFAEAHNNLGNVLKGLERYDEAASSFASALGIKPDSAVIHNNFGTVLSALGKPGQAEASYARALTLDPNFAPAHNNLGNALKLQHRLEEAESSFRRALDIDPSYAEAEFHLGAVLCARDRIEEGFASFTRYAHLTYREKCHAPNGHADAPHKARHDAAQRAYLDSIGIPYDDEIFAGRFHLAGGDRLLPAALDPKNSPQAVASGWRKSDPKIVVIDDFLTPDALAGLRRFCWGSTIWRETYANGYVAALPEHGLACPLLGQIAEELRVTHPAIFAGHPLLHFWAFKYDSALNGTKLHADNAAINVNFWLTPDDANLDPESGGMIVWDVAAPLDWDSARYNGSHDAIRAYLDREGAKAVRIPYRANRAVIFDSDLFHETDRIAFKDNYVDRRISMTLLYGKREAETAG